MYLRNVSPRTRILAFGAAGVLVLAGAICAALINSLTGQLLTIVLLSFGLGGAVLLVFLEIGLSEDRDRAREQEAKRNRSSRRAHPRTISRSSRLRRPRRPS